jgi:uncharacterized protein (DUF2249 family)
MSHPDLSGDREAAEAVVRHHAELAGALNRHTERLLAAAERADGSGAEGARLDLLAWLRTELVPHAGAEEQALYPAAAARPEGALLVEGMLDEHRTITGLVAELDVADSPVRAASAARALAAVFATHLAKENNLVVPLLVEAADVSLAGLLEGMHALLGGQAHAGTGAGPAADEGASASGCGCGGCRCGGGEEAAPGTPGAGEAPVLGIDPRVDVRGIPHEQRHATVIAALEAVPRGGALVLVAGHAPRPLLAEVESRFDGEFDVDWLQSGPSVWQVRLERSGARV